MRSFLVFFIILISAAPRVFAANRCAKFYATDVTEDLISYFTDLLEHRQIQTEELAQFVRGLKQGELVNPIANDKLGLDPFAMIHGKQIESYLETPGLDSARLLKWSQSILAERQGVQVQRDEAKVETAAPFEPLKWGGLRSLAVTKTPVTQGQWAELMGGIPVNSKNQADAVTVTINGKRFNLQPDQPVVNVTLFSAAEFANRLSLRDGLEPVYDMSHIVFFENTSAENGTWAPRRYEDIPKVKPAGGDGKQGYRLPVLDEAVLVRDTLGGDPDFYFWTMTWKKYWVAEMDPRTKVVFKMGGGCRDPWFNQGNADMGGAFQHPLTGIRLVRSLDTRPQPSGWKTWLKSWFR